MRFGMPWINKAWLQAQAISFPSGCAQMNVVSLPSRYGDSVDMQWMCNMHTRPYKA